MANANCDFARKGSYAARVLLTQSFTLEVGQIGIWGENRKEYEFQARRRSGSEHLMQIMVTERP